MISINVMQCLSSRAQLHEGMVSPHVAVHVCRDLAAALLGRSRVMSLEPNRVDGSML
jgi:hypothetical protein